MSIILTALRNARSMIETERAAFVDCNTLPNGRLVPDDQAIRQEYDDVLALIRAAVASVETAKPVAWGVPNSRITEHRPLMMLLHSTEGCQYPELLVPLYLHPPAPEPARPLADWHEDIGPVVWWKLPVDEPAWIGTPLDDEWPGYHTHWTPHPPVPEGAR